MIVTDEELERLRERACTRKEKYGPKRARNVAASMKLHTSEPVQPYRCPFESGDVWHVGHVMSWEGVEQLAEAIRFQSYPQGGHMERGA